MILAASTPPADIAWGPVIGAGVTGVFAALAAFLGAYYLFRGKNREIEAQEDEAETQAVDAFLKGQQTFQAYVDGVVKARVDEATAGFKAELSDMKVQMAAMRQESHEMNDAIRARETQLWLWNVRNRPGPMPLLPEPILIRLGLTHLASLGELEDTIPIPPKE